MLAHLGFAVDFVLEELDLLNRPELGCELLELNVRGPPETPPSAPANARCKPERAMSGQRCKPPWEARTALATPRARLEAALSGGCDARAGQGGAAHTRGACMAQAVPRQVVGSVQPTVFARLRALLLRTGLWRETHT